MQENKISITPDSITLLTVGCRQGDVLSISTNIGLTSMIEKNRLTLYFYITRRQFTN